MTDFTDYVFRTPINDLDSIEIRAGRPLILSNVVLDIDKTLDTGSNFDLDDFTDKLIVHDLDAANMNVLMAAKRIDIKGNIKAQNVRAQSILGTATWLETLENLTNISFDDPASSLESPIFALKDTIEDMISLVNISRINVEKGAKIEADQDIVMLSRVKQFGTILKLIPVNAINVKVAIAEIKVKDGAELNAKNGTVSAEAKIETITGEEIEEHDEADSLQVPSGHK